MPSVSPLAPCSHDWIGGDIPGLQSIAEKLYAYLPHISDLTGHLSVTARDLTDGGPGAWRGKAASAFTGSWDTQVKTAAALEDYVTGVAQAIDGLAVQLSQLENALERQAADASSHGVRIDGDGNVVTCTGARGAQWAGNYQAAHRGIIGEATACRAAAASQLNSLYQAIANANPHPNGADVITTGGLLADLLAAPTAARREVKGKIKDLTGKDLNFRERMAEAARAGETLPEKTFKESAKIEKELEEVKQELARTGKTESELSKLLDSRVGDVKAFLQGNAGDGRHVGGNTEADLRAAAGEEPSVLKNAFKFGDNIPIVDVATTVIGTGVGTYYDVKGGQSLGSALRDEGISNTVGTVAGNVAGVEIGARLGAAGGPIGVAAGAVIGYGVGDTVHNVLIENWDQDVHTHGVVGGLLHGSHHVLDQTADDARETAIGVGHDAEHYWDDIFG